MKSEQVQLSVGAVVFRGEEILLIKRGKAPFKDNWSIPGGKVDYGESLHDAVRREIMEETQVDIAVVALIDVFEAPPRAHGGVPHYVMVDYIGEWVSGEPIAGDDAAAAEFVDYETAIERLSWDETRRAVTQAIDLRNALRETP